MVDYKAKDSDGRTPLSAREYEALKNIFVAFNALTLHHKELERRCKSYKNGWRNLRLLVKYSDIVMQSVLNTIPTKKLIQIEKELKNTVCILKTQGVTGIDADGYMYVPENAMIDLCDTITGIVCFGCEKTHKEARRHCDTYKKIQQIFGYEFDECGSCPFQN